MARLQMLNIASCESEIASHFLAPHVDIGSKFQNMHMSSTELTDAFDTDSGVIEQHLATIVSSAVIQMGAAMYRRQHEDALLLLRLRKLAHLLRCRAGSTDWKILCCP